MDHCPGLVVGGFLGPCLQHFSDLLSGSNRARSIKAASTKALLKVLGVWLGCAWGVVGMWLHWLGLGCDRMLLDEG